MQVHMTSNILFEQTTLSTISTFLQLTEWQNKLNDFITLLECLRSINVKQKLHDL